MTFLEAAIEILRNAEGALHFSEVTRRAVDENLLSHVGRDPEAAMRSCLNSAARAGRNGEEPLIVREKPGYYGVRPGAKLPDPPPRPAPAMVSKKSPDPKGLPAKPQADSSRQATRGPTTGRGQDGRSSSGREQSRGEQSRRDAGRGTASADSRKREGASDSEHHRGRRERRGQRENRPSQLDLDHGSMADPSSAEEATVRKVEKSGSDKPIAGSGEGDKEIRPVEFEAPTGSGLEGITDVALVMANAMSRLVEERPELKDELDAMQQRGDEPEAPAAPQARTGRARAGRDTREVRDMREPREPREARPPRETREAREAREAQEARDSDERGGRRRRRRRRRGKRVEWSGNAEGREGSSPSATERLLEGVAAVLEESGARSLHIRQIAESLAQREVLGGEISEIERAVTAAILWDIRQYGRSSRFEARGEARYQLQGARLPEKAARAERGFREALRTLEEETRGQLVQWLQALGARSLESLVRMYLQQEGYRLATALPPGRGTGRLVVEDPEADDETGKALVLVIPRRTPLEPKLWEGELERNGCGSLLIFAMGEGDDTGEGRIVGAQELGDWLIRNRIGVTTMKLEVPVLDPAVIESIAGLDT